MEKLAKLKTSREREKQLEQLSPFELKDSLIALAGDRHRQCATLLLNAGRGNPNWIATYPREAFLALSRFGLEECRLEMDKPVGLAGIPRKEGIAQRFEAFLLRTQSEPGTDLLRRIYEYGKEKHGFDADAWALELAEGVMGDQYPDPVRMLAHTETIVHDYLIQEMCAGDGSVKYDLFATEGGTAAMCYVFDSLMENGLLHRGDRIALGVPIFTPYLEIPVLDRYDFDVVYVQGSARDKDGNPDFQYPDGELDKLRDKSVKAFFIVNPSNPTSVMISDESRRYLVDLVQKDNPQLIILTDDVYGTFVPGFVSLMRDLPRNTLCVYSFSKYFGATGWRLGAIALAEDNIYDEMLAALPQEEKERQAKMYDSLTVTPEKLKFIDRMAADSRDVALNHTAGLSLPQQTQMMLFAGFALLDTDNFYKKACIELLHHRYGLLWQGLGMPSADDPNRADYYSEIDMQEWAVKNYGGAFFDWLKANYEPVDVVFRLAERSSVVLLNGGGFAGPEWSVRVSLANLDDEDYAMIGRDLAQTMQEYADAWKEASGKK